MSHSPPSDNRPPIAVAMEWASRVTTASLAMALPALGGHWLDSKWGTSPWLLVVGAGLGFLVGFRELLRLSKQSSRRPGSSGKKSSESSTLPPPQ